MLLPGTVCRRGRLSFCCVISFRSPKFFLRTCFFGIFHSGSGLADSLVKSSCTHGYLIKFILQLCPFFFPLLFFSCLKGNSLILFFSGGDLCPVCLFCQVFLYERSDARKIFTFNGVSSDLLPAGFFLSLNVLEFFLFLIKSDNRFLCGIVTVSVKTFSVQTCLESSRGPSRHIGF